MVAAMPSGCKPVKNNCEYIRNRSATKGRVAFKSQLTRICQGRALFGVGVEGGFWGNSGVCKKPVFKKPVLIFWAKAPKRVLMAHYV